MPLVAAGAFWPAFFRYPPNRRSIRRRWRSPRCSALLTALAFAHAAARPRPRRSGDRPVPRTGFRWRRLAEAPLCSGGAAVAGGAPCGARASCTSYDRFVAPSSSAAIACCLPRPAPRRTARRGRCPPRAAPCVRRALRLAIGNIHRPGALTPSVVLSLGLGLDAARHAGADRRQPAPRDRRQPAGAGAELLLRRYPEHAMSTPSRSSWPSQAPRGELTKVPMLRGRIIGARTASTCAKMEVPADGAWVLRGDRGMTYADDAAGKLDADRRANGGRRTIAASRWCRSPPKRAGELGLTVGDTVTVNVLGRNITATDRQLARRSSGSRWRSISSWCSRPTPSPARRMHGSRR